MQRSLVSLSIITALWEERQTDYLDNFVPFIATLLNRSQINEIDVEQVGSFSNSFYREFGLHIPFHPMVAILNRSRRNGLLSKSHHKFYLNKRKASELDFSDEEATFIRKQRTVVNDFLRYAAQQFNIAIDSSVAENVLLDLLKHNDIEILFASREVDTVLPEFKTAKKYKQYLHVLQRYIIFLHGNNVEFYRYLADLAVGHMIASVIVIEDYDWPGDAVRNCEFYLDAPIIFKLIGADGQEQEAAYSDFFTNMTNNGAKLCIFDHTYHEVTEILENCRRWVNNPDFDPERASQVALFFRQSGFTDTDIQKFINRADAVLSKHEVTKRGVPPYDKLRKYQIDEKLLQTMIEKCYVERDSLFDKELYKSRTRRDVDSISAIYRLRDENRPRSLRQAQYVFLTTNAGLVITNRRYLQREEDTELHLPACLTDVFVGTLLWMSSPLLAKQDRRSRLIASCYAAVRPDRALEKRLLDEAKKLKSENRITRDDFVLLSTSFVTRDLLSDLTLNDKEAFTTEILYKILEEAKARIRNDAIEPYVRENRELAEQQRKTQLERDKVLSSLERLIDQKARQRAIWSTVLHVGAIVFSVFVPLIPMFMVGWYFGIISIIAGIFTIYLTFIKGFTFKDRHNHVYQRERAKIKTELMST